MSTSRLSGNKLAKGDDVAAEAVVPVHGVAARTVMVTASWWLPTKVTIPVLDTMIADGSADSNVKRLLMGWIQDADARRSSIFVPSLNMTSMTIALVDPAVPLNVAGIPDQVALFTEIAVNVADVSDTERVKAVGLSSSCQVMTAESCDVPVATPWMMLPPVTDATEGLLEVNEISEAP